MHSLCYLKIKKIKIGRALCSYVYKATYVDDK